MVFMPRTVFFLQIPEISKTNNFMLSFHADVGFGNKIWEKKVKISIKLFMFGKLISKFDIQKRFVEFAFYWFFHDLFWEQDYLFQIFGDTGCGKILNCNYYNERLSSEWNFSVSYFQRKSHSQNYISNNFPSNKIVGTQIRSISSFSWNLKINKKPREKWNMNHKNLSLDL
jgi:hypothetical protein